MTLEEVRNGLRRTMQEKGVSLRGLEELTGVSFATLSRFLRNGTPSSTTWQTLEDYLTGKPKKEVPPICVRRFKVGKKTFVVEIREEL